MAKSRVKLAEVVVLVLLSWLFGGLDGKTNVGKAVSAPDTRIWDGKTLLETRLIYKRYSSAESFYKKARLAYGSLAGTPPEPTATDSTSGGDDSGNGFTDPIHYNLNPTSAESFGPSHMMLREGAFLDNPLADMLFSSAIGKCVFGPHQPICLLAHNAPPWPIFEPELYYNRLVIV